MARNYSYEYCSAHQSKKVSKMVTLFISYTKYRLTNKLIYKVLAYLPPPLYYKIEEKVEGFLYEEK